MAVLQVRPPTRAVAEVVRSGRLALGPKTEEFEHLVAEYVGVKHAVAVSSGAVTLTALAAVEEETLVSDIIVDGATPREVSPWLK